MDYKDYQNKKEELHFWFKARKIFLEALIASTLTGKNNRILDIGCGTGDELETLKTYGNVSALDINEKATELARSHGCQTIIGDIQKINLNEKYDCICCFDLLEHLEQDEKALANIFEALKPEGKFIFTVPAYQWLYSPHDEYLEHFRRYNKNDLIKKLKKSNFKIIQTAYWNTFLFPLMVIFRLIKKILYKLSIIKNIGKESAPPNKLINNLLFHVLNQEKSFLSSKISAPFGLSLYGIAKKQ